jgi:hypothetical protein
MDKQKTTTKPYPSSGVCMWIQEKRYTSNKKKTATIYEDDLFIGC